MAQYTLGVPSCYINNIRSLRTDTLVASVGLRVMNAQGALHQDWPPQSVSLGDYESKTGVETNLFYLNVDVPDPTAALPDGGAIYWSFLLTNAGHSDSAFVAIANKAIDAFAGALAGNILQSPSIANVVSLSGLLGLQELLNVLTANCDGIVAVLAVALTAKQLAQMTVDPKNWLHTQNCPGTSSPVGCGSNSNYDVTYVIANRAVTTVPNLIGQSPEGAVTLVQEAGLLLSEVRSQTGSPRQAPRVESQSPGSGTQAAPASWVEATIIYPVPHGHQTP